MWLNCSINAVEVRLKIDFKGTRNGWMFTIQSGWMFTIQTKKQMDVHHNPNELQMVDQGTTRQDNFPKNFNHETKNMVVNYSDKG